LNSLKLFLVLIEPHRKAAPSESVGDGRWAVGPTDFYETLRKDHKLRVLSGGLFKKSKNSFFR
jgi:hypothetical protein